MNFEFIECFSKDNIKIEGLYEIHCKTFKDKRGLFLEGYNQRQFFEAGLTMKFVQDNISYSRKNVLRGMHFQKNHAQGKLICPVSGKIFDAVVDLRKDSQTFGKSYSVILDSKTHNELYVPEGFAHGFYVLSRKACVLYKCSDFYYPEEESGFLWNSKAFDVDWKLQIRSKKPIINERDLSFKEFKLEQQ
ncbi:MAG: dTDP-4-dehydrorhamnose 3,5-epimerase [Treponema sp.]|nr:dTDP-4-dehydrorhamnose 3,5-epimerase [Treponema sp.]